MTDQHTPGPWITVEQEGGTWALLSQGVAFGPIVSGALMLWPQAAADRRLIAAAPAMLEALREVRIYLRVIARESAPGDAGDAVAAIQAIDEAIAAATEEEVSA